MPLAWFFLKTSNSAQIGTWEISADTASSLCAYDWPGNVRELRNTIRRACILAPESVITSDLLPFTTPQPAPPPVSVVITPVVGAPVTTSVQPLWVIEKAHIQQVLELVEGNKSKAARILEIDRKTLYAKLERYELT
jgi:two-component system NtrC family response regulator